MQRLFISHTYSHFLKLQAWRDGLILSFPPEKVTPPRVAEAGWENLQNLWEISSLLCLLAALGFDRRGGREGSFRRNRIEWDRRLNYSSCHRLSPETGHHHCAEGRQSQQEGNEPADAVQHRDPGQCGGHQRQCECPQAGLKGRVPGLVNGARETLADFKAEGDLAEDRCNNERHGSQSRHRDENDGDRHQHKRERGQEHYQ